MSNILAIGSHYDDIEIGCGGTLLKHRDKGDSISLAILKSDESLTGDSIIRQEEQRRATAMLRASCVEFLNECKMEYIVGYLDDKIPDVIYFPHQDDYHQDHLKAYQVGMAVGRKRHVNMLAYLTPTSYDYYPNVFSYINIVDKIKLVSCHKSQMERRPDYIDTMIAQHQFFGSLSGAKDAEGFVFHRMIMNV